MWDLNPLQAVLETAAHPDEHMARTTSTLLYIYTAEKLSCQEETSNSRSVSSRGPSAAPSAPSLPLPAAFAIALWPALSSAGHEPPALVSRSRRRRRLGRLAAGTPLLGG